jgi:RimJ/RimL family protein N-acetyltransferase
MLLCCSFTFETLALPEIHCCILEGNERALRPPDRMGWKRDPRYGKPVDFCGERTRHSGFSMSSADWPRAFEAHREFLGQRLVD